MMRFLHNFLFVLYCLFFSACATTAYYTAQTDPQITFDKQEPLTIILEETPSVTDKKFGLLLGELLVENGFYINGFNMQVAKTKCYIAFSINTSSSQHTRSYTTYDYNSSVTYIPGTFTGSSFNPGRTITTTTTTPNTKVYTVTSVRKKVSVGVYCKDSQNRNSQIWFGAVGADISNYEKYEKNIIQNLIQLIGKDFKGKIELHQNR